MKLPFQSNRVGSLIISLAVAIGLVAVISVTYFYIYLPNSTNHGETITVPDLYGMQFDQLEEFLSDHELRFEVDDSTYSDELPPLSVLRQYPHAGARVKEDRKIFVSLNRVTPPTVPMPDLVDRSRINAEVVLKSNELRRGKIFLDPGTFLNLVKEMRFEGKTIDAGTRVPKGAVIDLVIGSGMGNRDFVIGTLIGDSYDRALFKLQGWNLRLGLVEIPADIDTTGMDIFVYKQYPEAGDSVRVGDPVDIWIGPEGYKETDNNQDDR